MSPPPIAALALLGIWILVIFFVTNDTGYAQLLSEGTERFVVPDLEDDGIEASGPGETDATETNVRTDRTGRDATAGPTDANSETESTPAVRSPADD